MKYLIVLFTVVIFLSSCSSKKILVKRELIEVDTVISVAKKDIDSKVNFKVKDTVITDKKTGVKIIFKKDKDTTGKEIEDSGSFKIEIPEEKVPVKFKKIIDDYKSLSLESKKLKNILGQKRDSLKYDLKKEELKKPKRNFWGRIEDKIVEFSTGVIILSLLVLILYHFVIKKD